MKLSLEELFSVFSWVETSLWTPHKPGEQAQPRPLGYPFAATETEDMPKKGEQTRS